MDRKTKLTDKVHSLLNLARAIEKACDLCFFNMFIISFLNEKISWKFLALNCRTATSGYQQLVAT